MNRRLVGPGLNVLEEEDEEIMMMMMMMMMMILIIRRRRKKRKRRRRREENMYVNSCCNFGGRKKEAEKILKYKDLTIEIQRLWNVKTKVIPVITGATGTISKSFRKYVSNIPGNHEVKEVQKTAILGTAHILRKMLT